MSLLIPNIHDYEDARDGFNLVPVYQEKLAKFRDNIDPITNQFTHPWDFEVVQGFFKQSDPTTDDLKFNYATHDFGITKPWTQIVEEIEELNEKAGENECYKILFLARHGQGYHNVVVSKYGHKEWNRKWHALGQDGDIVYAPDPELTDIGIKQAKENHMAWKVQLAKGAPLCSKYYVSPLQRSCNTLLHTWSGILPDDVHPVISEKVREVIGFHLCNKRSSKTKILERFGKYSYITEPDFAEEDMLHKDDIEETFDENCLRINGFMQELFDNNFDYKASKVNSKNDQFISVTSHAGTNKCFLAVIGHRPFTISTGGMIPVVVKGTRRT